MCIICIEFQKGKLTWGEAHNNWGEMDPNDKHTQEVLDMLNESLYNESKDSDGSDYQNEKELDEDSEEMCAFWTDDLLDWSDYAT